MANVHSTSASSRSEGSTHHCHASPGQRHTSPGQRHTSPGVLRKDGAHLQDDGSILTTKAAVEPVWYLPAVARRFGMGLSHLAHSAQSGKCELIGRSANYVRQMTWLESFG